MSHIRYVMRMLSISLPAFGAWMILLHTYWPFGDESIRLSNLDSLIHASALWLIPYGAERFWKWRARISARLASGPENPGITTLEVE